LRTFGLIGKSLAHSFSATYFEQKFNLLAISDCEYRNFEMPSINSLRALIQDTPSIEGLNVTVPYKEKVLPILDELSADAKTIGAVNCIEVRRELSQVKLIGHNSDWYGFLWSLKPMIDLSIANKALILGTGGASKAVAYALDQVQIPYQFVSRYAGDISYQNISEKDIFDCNVIINTTPLGTYPDILNCPAIPYSAIKRHHLVVDLVYNPEKTLFLSNCEAQGAKIKNGYEMLSLQAEKSWEIWNNSENLQR
jgi:shikimate dehydrogenase